MSETRTAPAPPLFGQILGQAHRASSALLGDLLAQHDTPFETWVGLNTLAQREPGTDRDRLQGDLATALQSDEEAVGQLFAELEARGLIRVNQDGDAASITLTPMGQAKHAELRESIGTLSAQLLGDVDLNDLAAARRVLEHMTERAKSLRT